ncbi:hypothetical protein CM240_3359 [Clostridium bornimense]|uniref:Uncharacterized protein n=1 Tax=Clostridium bornimense TaxID=1216932 RepID=W6S0P0_9CLOT|nr:DUF3006 domain-containing protein [Clostridium bornimense]CDM70476.1 hypothetical protein CM240_3359 [Clostridium bornimense]
MRIIIDRFEDDMAICEKEDRSTIEIEKNKIPIGAKEGTILIVHNDKIVIDKKSTDNKKYKIESLLKDLFS